MARPVTLNLYGAGANLQSGAGPASDYNDVSGSGFGTKLQQSTPIFETFAAANDGQLLSSYDASWINYAGSGGIVRSLNPRYSGHKSAYND